MGQKIVPGLLDIYLGKTGYKSQQYNGPRDPDAPINLWEPAPGDYGAHGEFDSRSKPSSKELWLATHGSWTIYAAAAAFVLGAISLARKIA